MELPKNITQIGEVGGNSRVYVEDYVVSYLKQLNACAEDGVIAVALYGTMQQEQGISYFFVYGACRLEFLQREVKHLSQAQNHEIEKLRKKHFPEYNFIGYRILTGEMIDGFWVHECETCRCVEGFLQFYEKNDAMLAYMLATREDVKPEEVCENKYEEIKHRQSLQREAHETVVVPNRPSLRKLRYTVAMGFAVLCLFGMATFQTKNQERTEENSIDPVNSANVQITAEKDVIRMEDKLESALRDENMQLQEKLEVVTEPSALEAEVQEQTVTETSVSEMTVTEPVVSGSVAYVIQPGDTLISISIRQYGTDTRVRDICKENHIENPDDIKQGQVIMLPK